MDKIIKANKKDIPRIVKIFREEYSKFPWNEKWSHKIATKRISDYFKSHRIFVLKINRKVEGFVIFTHYMWHTGLRGFLHEIVISKEFQGKGYGKKLMNFVENHFKKKGAKEINLMTSSKSKAYKIYKKRNYQQEKNFVSMYKKL
jgi:ribosomal protein S18 acetylase RimI-like enzyme